MTDTLAYRNTPAGARIMFDAGYRIIVATCDHGETMPVHASTVTHSSESTDWDDLVRDVDTWRNRYPGQTFYAVPADDRESSWVRAWEPPTPIGPVTRHGDGPWDELTRGFWTGGRRLEAWELRPGDVFRHGTFTGYVVTAVARGRHGEAVTILVSYAGSDTPLVLSPGTHLELEAPEVTR